MTGLHIHGAYISFKFLFTLTHKVCLKPNAHPILVTTQKANKKKPIEIFNKCEKLTKTAYKNHIK